MHKIAGTQPILPQVIRCAQALDRVALFEFRWEDMFNLADGSGDRVRRTTTSKGCLRTARRLCVLLLYVRVEFLLDCSLPRRIRFV